MAINWTIGGDAADPQRLARFWAAALDYVVEPGFDSPEGAGIVDPADALPAIGFLRVPEGKTAKNRLHIDIRVAGPGLRDAASAERMRAKALALVGLGATQVREEFYGPDVLGHIVMLDLEGNEFCVG
ncbi:VOC family protein [Kribbella sp. NPDC000426]|uniref:VOC family protein n=1 Tax=Kribbella sp. NPDC000426 TaxID=3154255 RepID=UPI00332D90A4